MLREADAQPRYRATIPRRALSPRRNFDSPAGVTAATALAAPPATAYGIRSSEFTGGGYGVVLLILTIAESMARRISSMG